MCGVYLCSSCELGRETLSSKMTMLLHILKFSLSLSLSLCACQKHSHCTNLPKKSIIWFIIICIPFYSRQHHNPVVLFVFVSIVFIFSSIDLLLLLLLLSIFALPFCPNDITTNFAWHFQRRFGKSIVTLNFFNWNFQMIFILYLLWPSIQWYHAYKTRAKPIVLR